MWDPPVIPPLSLSLGRKGTWRHKDGQWAAARWGASSVGTHSSARRRAGGAHIQWRARDVEGRGGLEADGEEQEMEVAGGGRRARRWPWRARLERGGEADSERRRRQGGGMAKRHVTARGVGAAGATLSSPQISLPFPFLPRLPISISSLFCGAGSCRPRRRILCLRERERTGGSHIFFYK